MKSYKKGLTEFFAELDKIDSDLESFGKEQKEAFAGNDDTFFCHFADVDNDRFKEPHAAWKKNKHLHYSPKSPCTVNGHTRFHYPAIYLWFTIENYMKLGYTEVWEKSERIKVIHNVGKYQFCLIRDNLKSPTDNYWGHRFGKHKLAIMEGGKVIYSTTERWEMEKFCTQTKKVELRNPETPSEIFRYFHPFKAIIVPLEDESKVKYLSAEMDMHSNTPLAIYEELKKYGHWNDKKNKWVVFLLGIENKKSQGSTQDRNATWFIYGSKTKPTADEAIYDMMRDLDLYDEEDFIDVLEKLKQDFEQDLNKVNLRAEDRIRDLFHRKLSYALECLLNTSTKTLKEKFAEWVQPL